VDRIWCREQSLNTGKDSHRLNAVQRRAGDLSLKLFSLHANGCLIGERRPQGGDPGVLKELAQIPLVGFSGVRGGGAEQPGIVVHAPSQSCVL